MKKLPDDRGIEDDVSVEEFGRAYLKGYGWFEGRGIGKNVKDDDNVKVVEFKRTSVGEGLGFVRTDNLNTHSLSSS